MHPKDTDGLGADLAALFAPPSARDMAREPFRVLIYVRVSSPEQTRRKGKDGKRAADDAKQDAKQRERDEELSPATQEKRCRDWVDDLSDDVTRGRKVVVTVYPEAFTSRVLWGRPVFRTIMAEIAAGRVDLLVCLKPERLGANSEQQAILRFMLRQQGGELAYVTQGYEDTVMGRVMATLWAEFNTMRLESLREQFRRRQVAKVDSGKVLHSSHPPYGCDWADDDHEAYVFVPETTKVVVLIFEWYADGLSRRAIARKLNDRGVPPPGGGKGWYDRSVQVILENPIYVGRPQSYRYVVDVLPGLTKTGKLRRRTRARTDEDEEQPREASKGLAAGAVPPVSEELWARVRARMADVAAGADVASRGGRSPDAPDDWLLRGGYLLCGTCAGPMQCSSAGGKHGTKIYICRANAGGVTNCTKPVSISKHLAEAKVWERVVAYTQRPEAIERVLADYEASLDGDGGAGDAAAAGAARTRLLETEREIGALTAAFRDPDLGARSRAAVKAQLDDLEASAERLERELAELEARREAAAQAARERLEYAEAVRRIGAHLAEPPEAWPPAFRRMAVVGTAVEATVSPSAVRGWRARDREVVTTFPPDRERYAALAEALEGASQEGAASLPTANGHLWHVAARIVRPDAPVAGIVHLRLRLDGDGGLRVAGAGPETPAAAGRCTG